MKRILFTILALSATSLYGEVKFSRAPYVQLATEDSIHVVWRTEAKASCSVRYGTAVDKLDGVVKSASILVRGVGKNDTSGDPLWVGKNEDTAPDATLQFEAKIKGLKPNTTYYYAVYDGDKRLTPEDKSYRFKTHPKIGTKAPLKFWVVGDSGTGGKGQKDVYKGIQTYMKDQSFDLYLHVGDMAYHRGTDPEFSKNFFSIYEPILRNTVCWGSLGNHEGYTSKGATKKGPFFDAYVLPAKAEAGGVASGTESYYSFDYGNVHFICLNSHDLDRRPTAAMAKWLKADLERTKADWLIAFWHHPPYTKGSHDSDKEHQLIEMREHIMPILESGGVDAVFTGHSHIYERSMLIDGAYETPSTNKGVVLDDGDGDPKGDGAYKKSDGLAPHNGAVQVVAGNGGANISRRGNHVLMSKVMMLWGSMVMEVKENQLIGKMIDTNGEVKDTFVIEKGGKVINHRIVNPKAPELTTKDGNVQGVKAELQKVFETIIPRNAKWSYLAGKDKHPKDGWKKLGFDDSEWKKGKAGFGYGDDDDKTELDMRGKYTAVYLRKAFTLEDIKNAEKIGLVISYDDGVIVYINGTEVVRSKVAKGNGRKAGGVVGHEAGPLEYFPLKKHKGLFKKGKNVITIEGHNVDVKSSDFSLDPMLIKRK